MVVGMMCVQWMIGVLMYDVAWILCYVGVPMVVG